MADTTHDTGSSNASDPTTSSLPSTHRALVVTSVDQPLTVQNLPIPTVQPGTAVLRVLSAPTASYTREIYQSSAPNYRGFPFPTPIVPGFAAIGRVVDVAKDATAVKPGQLVLFDPFIRGRDLDGTSSAQSAKFLSAFFDGGSAGSRQLMEHGGVRDGSFAEYTRVMLENCYILDEERLLSPPPKGLGYSVDDLCAFLTMLVPYGGLRSVDVRPGETVLISPATGPFGGAACMVALALGARVIAWGRDVEKLQNLKAKLSEINSKRYEGMIEVVPLTSNAEEDLKNIKIAAQGNTDVFFDISPAAAQGSHHVKTGILSVRHSGRVSFMGSFPGDVPIPYVYVMHFDITIKGKWMYERKDVVELIKLVERGLLVIGKNGGWQVAGRYGLEDWKEAWDKAYESSRIGEIVVISP